MLIDLINGVLVLEDRQAEWEELAHYANWLRYSLWRWADIFAPELSKEYTRARLSVQDWMAMMKEDGRVYGSVYRGTTKDKDKWIYMCAARDKDVADGMCEACGKDVATRECAHGILCDMCDAYVHGCLGKQCNFINYSRILYRLLDFVFFKDPLHDLWNGFAFVGLAVVFWRLENLTAWRGILWAILSLAGVWLLGLFVRLLKD